METIWVVAGKKQTVRDDPIAFPLYYQNSDGQFVDLVDVEVDTNLPEQHWLIRGVKFCSANPLNMDIDSNLI